MLNLWEWIQDMGNSKTLALILFMSTFVGVVIYLFANPRRARKFETYRYIPLDDDDSHREPTTSRRDKTESDEQ
ncbi:MULTISPECIES: cbb3-type cytochrome c oxidase subunit 3 [unclassified Thioalkalivibrio]|uniref:cbb3-type cytochrome oxidase subunit 3 n=1 Tax=unclassified Thioalkalivibrio TaxID=2621013 RepID=UPI000363BA14|nr:MULTISPECIES: cbb3-type cytochrome c oxidase subunit 3 [unclassified Thioalkalivibrio]PYG01519.1 Cbb3-type cytochrome oxidase component FixQ [Thioalkalivibrio sp. ALE21]